MVTTPGAGVPTGTSDLFFCYEGFYGWLEFKRAKNAPFQPLQKEFIKKMHEWSYARVCYPENAQEIRTEIEQIL